MKAVDVASSPWWFVEFEGAKGHFVPSALVSGIIADMAAREFVEDGMKPVREVFLDRGGPIIFDSPTEVVSIDLLRIELFSDSVGEFLCQSKKLPLRKTPGGDEYYKLHEWHTCLVLTVTQKAALEQFLEDNAERAGKRGDEHFARWKRAMDEKNKRS